MRWWPMIVAPIVVFPLVGLALRAWPSYLVMGLAMAVAWWVAGLMFLRYPPNPAWKPARWAIGGLAAGLAVGLLNYLIP